MIDDIRKARRAGYVASEMLFAEQNRLRTKEEQLARARRRGQEGVEDAAALEREMASLKEAIAREQGTLGRLNAQLSNLVGTFVLPQTPQQLASQLDDRLPCVLFPLRVETRFMGNGDGRELWVRVYPDDIAVHTHEEALTKDEADAGVQYWTERALARSIEEAAERERREKGAWRALATSFGGTRASWIASEVKRRAIEAEGNADFLFLLFRVQIAAILIDARLTPEARRGAILEVLATSHPVLDLVRNPVTALLQADPDISDGTRQAILRTMDEAVLTHLGFEADAFKPESWSRAPRTEVMPDRFVLIGFAGGVRREWVFPNAVPSPLILGPNPQNLESELAQRGGDLVVGDDYAWIWDFQKAIEVGMAVRAPLTEPFASGGFDRLVVLGLRVSSEPADHKALLEELIDNHHYSPEGMGFLPQGAPTNHTSDLRSSVASADAEGDASFEIETEEPEPPGEVDDLEKTDAQRLAEAWDIDIRKLLQLRNANQQDVAHAKISNRALWPATLGYYLDELLELDSSTVDRIRAYFTANVVARGSTPVVRVGKQPYGVLLTSAFRKWQIAAAIDGDDAAFLGQLHQVLVRIEDQWQQLVGQVSHVDAGGDSFAHLLNMLGLHATSVDFARRIGTYRTALWNLAHFWFGGNFPASDPLVRYFQEVSSRGIEAANNLGLQFPSLPRLFGLLFSDRASVVNGPLVDDVATAEEEKLSESLELPARYGVAVTGEETEAEVRNYIGWVVESELAVLKQQQFRDGNGSEMSVPAALLYRMLHRALLLANYDATMTLYEEVLQVDPSVRAENDFTNVEADRTVTRWEFMEARVDQVMPQVSEAPVAVGDFLATPEGSSRPAARFLAEVRDAIGRLEHLSTAQLERLLAEHIDLCSYRLDAWQTSLFAQRLERLNRLREDPIEGVSRRGVHLGAYGWLENVRPAPAQAPVPRDQIPPGLREEGVDVVEQPGNGGFIHGPSINHAVAAAVLRNAYLTHARQENAEHFSVRLTSDRVRTAVSFLEGVRNGQELGALLGYQFERALHDRYVIDGRALSQFILAFRKQYPMVADKVTPGGPTDPIELKEAYQVVDGYALLEAVFLQEPPLQYPFGVEGLPLDPADLARQAIEAEIERLKDTLDAIADLSLAEGVFQVTQGNYERAGAMLKAISEGNAPPEPEIVSTPRGGAVVNLKVAIHFDTGDVASRWTTPMTPRAVAAPGLNKWLGDLIGTEESLQFSVTYDRDATVTPIAVADLKIQPIDLAYLIGDEAGVIEGTRQINDLTELEVRIDHAYRLKRQAEDPAFDPSGQTTINFMSRDGFPAGDVRTFFELLPLLRNLRNLVTNCRPLGADDYVLASEENTDPNAAGNPKRWDLDAMKEAVDVAAVSLGEALEGLETLTAAVPPGALNENPAEVPDLSGVDYSGLRDALNVLADFGLPGAFPKRALLPELTADPTHEERLALLRARQSLIEQALLTHDLGVSRHAGALTLSAADDLTPEAAATLAAEEKAGRYQQAAALLLGDAFRIIPRFTFRNRSELEAAKAFAVGAPADQSLLRFTHERLQAAAESSAITDWRGLAVAEWLQGAAAVRKRVQLLDEIQTFGETFSEENLRFEPLQLPFDERAHWIALEYPQVSPELLDDPASFVPSGDFLSIVRHLPEGHNAATAQAGLLIDEWNEVIPNRVETTGIAVHYNQPNTEPPQCVLIAVSPTIDGAWSWDDLVDTLTDTLDRARRRAVEPDMLRATPYAQLLPAVLSTFTSFPFGTISTNLAAQAASMVFEEGQ